ncbi:G-type lectin S-receptor-like serine/threonine-protein kinase [Dorcoceras hygrometricum]|uniref:G-type lectin S-receptor-like serine/threonine-protein kinase n=1 Tax=Dorcoceras hygrometricum TaxID=472368 RepID=A0A2Z7C0B4_9LAMI|nr:G-type lectin S-receptor-like serine/threonine-protein kinase [Dorcoceras hygrometricum]
MQRRYDQQPVIALDLPAPDTMDGALLAGPPPGLGGSNVTNHGPNQACTKENDPYKEGARRCAEARSAWCSPSSRCLQTELSKLKIKNDLLRTKSCELSSENERLSQVMSSWTKSYVSLGKLHETQKPMNDKSGLGFSVGESSSEGTCTQSNLAYDKFKKMNFFKASVIHDAYESVKYDGQTTGQLNHKGKTGIGYINPENSKPSWLTNRLEKDKAKAGPKSSVPN